MKVQDPHFILEKIRKYLDEDIRPTRYREIVDIEEWKYFETDMDDRIDDAYLPEYDDSGWADFRLWDTWGGYDKVAWFRTTVKIPESFRDGRMAVKLLVGPRDGGDSTAETLLLEALEAFEADPNTKAVMMIGEIGGNAEQDAAQWAAKNMTKPVVAYIAGFTAPEGKQMGHAGAIVSGGKGTAQDKQAALEAAGIRVGRTPSEAAQIMREVLSAQI